MSNELLQSHGRAGTSTFSTEPLGVFSCRDQVVADLETYNSGLDWCLFSGGLCSAR
jgi:hypothetical protein